MHVPARSKKNDRFSGGPLLVGGLRHRPLALAVLKIPLNSPENMIRLLYSDKRYFETQEPKYRAGDGSYLSCLVDEFGGDVSTDTPARLIGLDVIWRRIAWHRTCRPHLQCRRHHSLSTDFTWLDNDTTRLQTTLLTGYSGSWMQQRLVSGTCKFERDLPSLLHSDLHWVDLPERISTTKWTLLCIAACRRKLRGTWSTVAHQFRKSPAVDNYAQPVDDTLLWERSGAGPTSLNSLPDRFRDPTLSINSFRKLLRAPSI